MSADTALPIFAEIGAGFAGFVALVSVLFTREDQLRVQDALRFRALLVLSISTTLLALLPLVLATTGIEGATLWRTASLVASIWLVVVSVFQRRAETAADPSWVSRAGPERWLSWVLAVGSVALLAANALGVGWDPFAGAFLVALYFLLSIAAVQFVGLVIEGVLVR